MKNTFRTAAVGGFNRQDVTDYISKTAAETAETIRALEQERDEYAAAAAEKEKLVDEVASLREQLSAAMAELELVRAERERLVGADEKNKALEEKVAELEGQAAEYHELKDHIAQVELNARRRSEELLAQAEDEAAAKRAAAADDAQAMLAKAAEESAAIRRELHGQVQAVAVDYAALLRDFDVMKQHVTSELRKMDVSFTQLPLSFNKVSAELKALEQKAGEE